MSDTFEAPAPEPEVTATPADQGAPADTPADTAAAETDTDAKDAGAEQPEKPRGGFQKRISELTEARRRAERDADHWREMATRAAQQPQAPQDAAPAAAQLPPDIAQWLGAEPKPGDFPAGEFDPNFTRAAARYDARVEQAKQELQRRQVTAQRQQAEFTTRVSSVVEEATKADPSLAEVLTDQSFPMPPRVVKELMDCEAPAAVLAFLGKNPAEAARIAALPSPSAVARALDRIETRLSAPPPVRTTNAPPPPPVLRGRASAPADLSKMSMEQYAATRRG